MSDKELFDKISQSIKEDHPSFDVRFKSESKYMKLLDLLSFPFNNRFLDGYTTTIGSTVYFPNREDLERNYGTYARVLAHEGVHIFDDERHGLWFKVSYALFEAAFIPLVVAFAIVGSWVPVAALAGALVVSYAVLALTRPARLEPDPAKYKSRLIWSRVVFYVMAGAGAVGYVALSIWLAKWWAFLGVGAFIPLIPFRSPWRAKWEYRGYSMGIAISYWKYGSYPDRYLEYRVPTFTGPNYYFMDPNKDRVTSKLKKIRLSVQDGSILVGSDARPFQRTLDVLKSMNLVSVTSA